MCAKQGEISTLMYCIVWNQSIVYTVHFIIIINQNAQINNVLIVTLTGHPIGPPKTGYTL